MHPISTLSHPRPTAHLLASSAILSPLLFNPRPRPLLLKNPCCNRRPHRRLPTIHSRLFPLSSELPQLKVPTHLLTGGTHLPASAPLNSLHQTIHRPLPLPTAAKPPAAAHRSPLLATLKPPSGLTATPPKSTLPPPLAYQCYSRGRSHSPKLMLSSLPTLHTPRKYPPPHSFPTTAPPIYSNFTNNIT